MHLAELTRTAGFVGDDATLSTICAVPYGFIRAERAYRKVHTFKNDRSTYEDAKPRIQRSRAGLAPNDIWVGDVHPVDVLYRRQDGSTATLRAIAWLDLGTNRLHATWIALDKGQGGVRNTHVIRSFTAAVAAWGAARALSGQRLGIQLGRVHPGRLEADRRAGPPLRRRSGTVGRATLQRRQGDAVQCACQAD